MAQMLFEMLTELPENRTAFIAALIMERSLAADAPLPAIDGIQNVPNFNAYQAARIAQNLVNLGEQIRKFAEIDCNRGLTDSELKRYSAAQTKFATIADKTGFVATTGGDPRGACAYIADKANLRDGDDMGGRGWGVYS